MALSIHKLIKLLENDFITLTITVAKDDEKNMLYTKEEKFQYILKKNAKITLLRDKLDLNII